MTQKRFVMNQAWFLIRTEFFSKDILKAKSTALKLSWDNYKLRNRLSKGIVEFIYLKHDGTIRKAKGTLLSELLPPIMYPYKNKSLSVQRYYDLEKNEFRSFRKSSLICIEN